MTFGLAFCASSCAAPVKEGVDIGQRAPNFLVSLTNGKPFKLADQKGKVVILHWFATWCVPCKAEWPDVKRMMGLWKKNPKVVVVGMDLDEPSGLVKIYLLKNKLTFLTGLDKDEVFYYKYEVPGLPYTVVIDKNGVVAQRSMKMDLRVEAKVKELLAAQ